MIEIINEKKDILNYFDVLKKRGEVNTGEYSKIVKDILADILENGDSALEKYTKKFDDKDFDIKNIEVSKDEQKEAFLSLDPKLRQTLLKSKDRIYSFHTHQRRESFEYKDPIGVTLGQKITPLEKVGVYVPGGKAVYPSSVLMNVMPALVAGVKEIIMVSPAINGKVNPLVLAAAYISNVTHFYKVGGAQAIGALAYGTKSISKVDKIVGPGNIFVALAKREVYGLVGIDSIAGPSEICIIADETCHEKFVASDLLGQAEHDMQASSTLLITSMEKALKVKEELINYYNTSSRKDILDSSLTNYSKIIVVDSIDEAIDYANKIAPEHLEIAMDTARDYLKRIKNAGAIFLGHYSAESLGDYMAGPNHVLPTVSTARFFSPLSVDDFIKKSSIIEFDEASCNLLIDDVNTFAMAEGLEMHALSARVRKS